MPFTPSHAAAALLFTRTPLIPAALVAGGVAPDLPYYFPVPVGRELTHEPLGVVTIDLAMALAAFLLWQFALRAPVLDFAPAWLRDRLPQRSVTDWHRQSRPRIVTALLLLASLVVGTLTHLIWDSFTHPGWVVDHLTVLRLQAGPLLAHKWLQHVSSVLGLVAIAVWTARWVQRTPAARSAGVVTDRIRRAAWIAVAAVFVISALVAWAIALGAQHAAGMPLVPFDPGVVFTTARVCVASALAMSVIACAGWYLYRSAHPAPTSPPAEIQNSGPDRDTPSN